MPEHWKSFGTWSSPISGATRNAGNPINALLNYVYAILETEVRLAILTMGLDPGMAILHSDLRHRDSFVYDVIEPLRPVVDDALLTMLEERTFGAKGASAAVTRVRLESFMDEKLLELNSPGSGTSQNTTPWIDHGQRTVKDGPEPDGERS